MQFQRPGAKIRLVQNGQTHGRKQLLVQNNQTNEEIGIHAIPKSRTTDTPCKMRHVVAALYIITNTQVLSHFDNAEVTLNANLGRCFESGELLFYGKKHEASAAPVAAHDWAPAGVGHAVLHVGAQVHAALPITEGERLNLVMWLRSTDWRRREGCPMCERTDGLLRPAEPPG